LLSALAILFRRMSLRMFQIPGRGILATRTSRLTVNACSALSNAIDAVLVRQEEVEQAAD
jgi:hypothetical protein